MVQMDAAASDHITRSAVVINGCPGPWFTCKKGLRQRDAPSPYLFLLVADVLQRRYIQFNGGVRHPLTDTLIVVRAEIPDVRNLKKILDNFASATGLHINFSKSTAVPIHVSPRTLPRVIRLLQCQEASFPQVYLGLPLSNLQAFAPLIAKVDKRLVGWQSALLSKAGRVILINSVLDSLATHFMSAIALPQGVFDQLESKRRAFLWYGKSKTTGACCLISWEMVQKPRSEAGLGI